MYVINWMRIARSVANMQNRKEVFQATTENALPVALLPSFGVGPARNFKESQKNLVNCLLNLHETYSPKPQNVVDLTGARCESHENLQDYGVTTKYHSNNKADTVFAIGAKIPWSQRRHTLKNHYGQGGQHTTMAEICVNHSLASENLEDVLAIMTFCATPEEHRQLYHQLGLSYAMIDITEDVVSFLESDTSEQGKPLQWLKQKADQDDISFKMIHTWID